jgi:hypothetical protein
MDGVRMSEIRDWRKWREKQKERSNKARRAITIRWERYHATKAPVPDSFSIPDPCYRITIENFVMGGFHILEFHPADKLNRFRITVDGKDWSTCGWSEALVRVRKSCVRMAMR